MTDYAEEQRNELEAIESIYPESFTVLSDDPTSFTITVTSDPGDSGETVEATIKFTYVEKYPDEPPLWEIHSQENLEERDAQDILTLLQQQVEENLGMVMIFTLVTAVQEKLNEIVDVMKNEEKTEGGEAGRQGQADGSLLCQVNNFSRETETWTRLIFSSWKTLETTWRWTSRSSRTSRTWIWTRMTRILTL
ncbi:unnamed protein product [Tetraodon nigroviridis]|uniref:RWD domain-containing protein 1 n=1 Tax=Tetraodon nigroviridis TaxID=99883 RepID=Q4S9A5_TETNG|nr:unnamed protein product [Tetraodon nigroviridis]